MWEMTAPEFVRRLNDSLENQADAGYAFLMGAGCPVSSGIPAAKELVWRWLDEFRAIHGSDLDVWLEKSLPNYGKEQAARFYSRVIFELPNTDTVTVLATDRMTLDALSLRLRIEN